MILLGSTGSIGQNTIAIAQRFHLTISVLCAGRNITLLNKQIAHVNPQCVVISHEADRAAVKHAVVYVGTEGIERAIDEQANKRADDSVLLINAIVGAEGLRPTLKALSCGMKVALANKESLVMAGKFIDNSQIIPIDSEHFGLWFLHQHQQKIASMQITASGGAFRDWPLEQLCQATLSDALKHPNWSMGKKITIDSATMVNKLFELIEARWLFGAGKYDAIIETRSLIHALINFSDGSTTAHLANANMQLPIAHALRVNLDAPIITPINLLEVGSLEFREIRPQRYAIWEIKEVLLEHPELGLIVNSANEVANAAFLQNRITFLEISQIIIKSFQAFERTFATSVDDIFSIEKEVKAFASNLC